MRYSIRDDIPDVFFRESICGFKFQYDSSIYSSVMHCFNSRKIAKRYWNPTTVPESQVSRMSFAGFLKNKADCKGYIFEEDVICNKKVEKQLMTIVMAELFVEYYNQVFSQLSDELKSKYVSAYSACLQVVNSIKLNTSMLTLRDYMYEKSYTDIVIKSDCNCVRAIPKEALSERKIYLSYDTSASMKAGFNSLLQTSSDLGSHVIVSVNASDVRANMILERIRGMYNNLLIQNDVIDYKNNDIIIAGNFSDIYDNNDIDWDYVHILSI